MHLGALNDRKNDREPSNHNLESLLYKSKVVSLTENGIRVAPRNQDGIHFVGFYVGGDLCTLEDLVFESLKRTRQRIVRLNFHYRISVPFEIEQQVYSVTCYELVF